MRKNIAVNCGKNIFEIWELENMGRNENRSNR